MITILKYIAEIHPQLRHSDPVVNAKADSIAQFAYADAHGVIGPATFSQEKTRDTDLKALVDKFIPKLFEKLADYLTDDKKFLTSDSISIYDIQVGGIFTNLICNPKAQDAEMWKASWEKAPERVKKFYSDFCEDMKPYLDERPEYHI